MLIFGIILGILGIITGDTTDVILANIWLVGAIIKQDIEKGLK